MTLGPAGKALAPLAGARLFASIAEHGSAAHPYQMSAALLREEDSTRNLADAVHFLCTVHGRHPGVIDHGLASAADPASRAWFEAAREGFSVERAFLARLVVEAGPVPATPGASSAQSALLSQRHALDMLARSERQGCALGAALALVADWGTIRFILNTAAGRLGVPVPFYGLMDNEALHHLADEMGSEPRLERAMLFGAEQLLLQHYGLWDLLEARQLARAGR